MESVVRRSMNHVGSVKLARRELLPGWLQLLSWLSLVYLLVPALLPLFAVLPGETTASAFGLSHRGSAFAPMALLISAVLFVHGVAAFGLLWGKSWGVTAAIGVCCLGLSISLYTSAGSSSSETHFAPVIQILVLIALVRVRRRWAEAGVRTADLAAVFD
jgi:hypothetical protein